MFFSHPKAQMVSPDKALPGRAEALTINPIHAINGQSMVAPFTDGLESIVFAMGCFWGVERKFWQQNGVVVTAVGYAGGFTQNPTYEEVCSGLTGHTEVVLVVFDPKVTNCETLLKTFWEAHDPTQGLKQGNDVGSQYRSAIYYTNDEQRELAEETKVRFEQRLKQQGFSAITTEIAPLQKFYYAETYHQQYLHKNPNGYCGLRGTGVCLI